MKTKHVLMPISICLLLFSCVKNTDKPADLDKVISLSMNDDENTDSIISLRADGISKLKIKAKLGEYSDDGKSITFYTSNGELISLDGANGTNNISQVAVNKEASIFLKASIIPENNVFISAKVNDYSKKRYLNFLPANPDTFFIKPEQYFTQEDKINIDVDLLRNIGYVSSKIPIYFETTVTDTTTGLKVAIEPFKFTENPDKKSPSTLRVTVQKINDTTGVVKVKVKFKNDRGSLLEKNVLVSFK